MTAMPNAPVSTPTKADHPQRYHWTIDTFYRAIDAGVFDEPKRLELIDGEIRTKEKVNPPHAFVTGRVARLLRALLEPGFQVREEKPLHIASDGEPVPDVLVAVGTPDDYSARHPGPEQTMLLVEVADASANYDTGEKAALYARAGIWDYWVVLINQRQVLVFRNPTPDGYPEPSRLNETDLISPLADPAVVIPVRDLLPRVLAGE